MGAKKADGWAANLVVMTVAYLGVMLVDSTAEKLAQMLAEKMVDNLVVKMVIVEVAAKDGNLVEYLVEEMAVCKAAM